MDIEKLEKKITKYNESFCSDVRGMTLQQIKDRLAYESLEIQRINMFLETNKEILELKSIFDSAKERLDEAMNPSKETIKKQNDKIKFLLINLEEKTITE